MPGGDFEETELTISGRPATKVVRVDMLGESRNKTIKVFCPTDTAVLTLQVSVREDYVNARLPEIEAIIASLTLAP